MAINEKRKTSLELKGIYKNYKLSDGSSLPILKDLNLKIYEGELVALVAPSGSGKSTIMHIAGLLDKPTKGKVIIDNQEIQILPDKLIDIVRAKAVGFVYQQHYLIPELSVVENVAIPNRIINKSKDDATNNAIKLLESIGLKDRITFSPSQLSGGEKQRVAIARALANSPSIILADEPTGNLDPKTAQKVFSIFINQIKKQNTSGLIVTHNFDLAKLTDRIIYLVDGKLQNQN